MFFVLLIIFVVVMLVWGLAIGKVIPGVDGNKLAFIAVLILGIIVFLTGSGVIVVDRVVK